jgi:hypothetical protein
MWSKTMEWHSTRVTNRFLLLILGICNFRANQVTEYIILSIYFQIHWYLTHFLYSQASPDVTNIVPFFQQLVHPPSTLDGYSFSNRLELSKSIKGGQFGIPDGRLALRARQRGVGGNPVESTVSYNTAVKGVAVMAQLDSGGVYFTPIGIPGSQPRIYFFAFVRRLLRFGACARHT